MHMKCCGDSSLKGKGLAIPELHAVVEATPMKLFIFLQTVAGDYEARYQIFKQLHISWAQFLFTAGTKFLNTT